MGVGFADYGIERAVTTPLVVTSLMALQGASGIVVVSPYWPAANLAIFIPFTLSEMITFKRMMFINCDTTPGNVDIGIYDSAGNRLVSSGSIPRAVTNRAQIVDIADTQLSPGRYYLALVVDVTVYVRAAQNAPGVNAFFGVREMAGAFPLPATATLTEEPTRNFIPLVAATLTE